MDGVGPFLRHPHLSGDVGSTGRRWKSCMWFGQFHGEDRRIFFFTWMDCRVQPTPSRLGRKPAMDLSREEHQTCPQACGVNLKDALVHFVGWQTIQSAT